MYHLRQFPYCGLSMPPRVLDTRAEGRKAAAALLRCRRRQGLPVAILVRGQSWEVLEPEGALMVPDACGTIELSHQVFECDECGAEHDAPEDARACCEAAEPATWEEGGDLPEGCSVLTAPSAWASYLINGDESGIDERERAQCDAWIEAAELGEPVSCRDAGFCWNHDAREVGALAADCQEYLFHNARGSLNA